MTEIKVPSPGESVLTVILASWLVADGEFVDRDQEIAEIDSDKATLSISAPEAGVITILIAAGEEVGVGEVIARIVPGEIATIREKAVEVSVYSAELQKIEYQSDYANEITDEIVTFVGDINQTKEITSLTPLARSYMAAEGLDQKDINGRIRNKRIKKADIEELVNTINSSSPTVVAENIADKSTNGERRVKMSPLRIKLSQRLVKVKNETAMLTTFNEVDMTEVVRIRKELGDQFEKIHGVRLGLMAFFTKAATIALQEFPEVNAFIDKDEIVYHDYVDMSIAVSSPKGLVVPVVRNAHQLTIAMIEQDIRRLADKARNNRLTLDEMTGGTFTISNGGVFGSMLSTPIINPPQSAILGMHNIVERPVARNGRVEIRPVMYIALSYDHRIIDGRESVGFLVKVKELIENPLMMTCQNNPVSSLLNL